MSSPITGLAGLVIVIASALPARAGALLLDGAGDFVTFPNEGIPSGSEPFTVEAWVNPDVHSDSTITFWGNEAGNQANGFRLQAGGATRHYFWGNDHATTATGDLAADTSGPNGDGWHHLAIAWNGTQTQWFWNGSPLEGPRSAAGVSVANVNHRIGSRLDAEFFDGLIDEVRIWDKARGAAEIAGDYNRQLTGSEPNLVAYFDFEGTFLDRAGNDNNGTPVGDASIAAGANAPVGTTGGPAITAFTATPTARFEGQSATLAWEVDGARVDGSLAVEILDPGNTVIHGSANANGNFAIVVGDTGGVPQSLTYTLRARETGGAMISREAIATIAADPGIPTVSARSLHTVATSPLSFLLSGSDPNTFPNAALSFAVLTPPTSGTLSGSPPALTYTANAGFTGSDSLTFRASDGKYDSAPATVTIGVAPAPYPPTDISPSTTSIGEHVPSGGLVATLTTTDPNAADTHTYSLVAGTGDADNGLFSIVGNQLRAATAFAGFVGNTYAIRLRSTDNGGLSYEKSFVLSVVEVSGAVVINEIHFNPPNNAVRQEFIELHNPADTAADLGGWRLSSAVSFPIPSGTTIPPGGYLVIAEDPPTVLATFGVTALGPFSGQLSGDGETVRLRDANDAVVDEADYKVGFPWPVAADGRGASIELIHPSLDNSLGSSWRASIPQNLLPDATLLALTDSGWSWRPGTTEASAPVDAWRARSFVEDGTWIPGVRTPIGYGAVDGVPLNTVISGMLNTYRCLFLRNTFTIAPGEIPSQLRLNYTADDGIVVWINGVEVDRKRFPAGIAPSINDLATANGPEGSYEIKNIVNPGPYLVEGSNTIAVQLFNVTLGSSDLGFDLEVVRPAQSEPPATPTPGARNIVFAANAAPNIRKVGHLPAQPTSAQPVVISALVTDPQGVDAVALEYQIVAPGAYVPAVLPLPIIGNNINATLPRPANPAYESGWITMTLRDDGTGGDALAGDDVHTVTLPPQPHRTLVRYRITLTDGLGRAGRVPYPDDASRNFAYFVYNGIPAYEGNSAQVMARTLPVYHLLTRAADYAQCIAYNGADQITQGSEARFLYNWDGAIVCDGVVHDNITYRLRGANGRYQNAGKRSMRVRFNEGSFLQARDLDGDPYPNRWRTLTMGKGNSNRGTLTYALNEAVNYRLFDTVGVPSPDTLWLQWRVIDGAAEAPDRWRGDFHGLYFVSETYDVRFLEAHNLEKGNLYKLINQTTDWERQRRYQAAFAPANGADHNNIENSLDGADSAAYIGAHVNLDKWNRWHALAEAIRHYDFWPSANKNMVYYFEPAYLPENSFLGKLWILPWDTDSTWGPTYNSGHDVVYNALFPASGGGSDANATPELWPEYFNIVREVRDLLWQPDQIHPLLDEFASRVAPIIAADSSRWKGAPADAGNYNGLAGPGMTSLAAYVQDMKNFAFVGGSWPDVGVGAGGRAAFLDSLQASQGEGGQIPNTPTITYSGAPGFPTNGLAFQSGAFADPQGAGTFGAMEWRIARVTDPSAPAHDPADRLRLEWDADWKSGVLGAFAATVNAPTTAVRSGLTYRARVRHRDSSGRWSHWSAPLQFTTTLPDISDHLNGLVVTEIMYHPANPSAAEIAAGFPDDKDFEFIELRNVGPVPLDLADVRFTKGVDFDFLGSDITTLAPGAFVLVVASKTAFEMRYGAGLPVAGEWESTFNLGNGGEQLKLSFGAGDPIRDFDYNDQFPWPTSPDGGGPSLTLANPLSVPDHGLGANWRASHVVGGTPGADDPGETYASWRDATFGPGSPPLSGELDDADGDGLVNALEYVLVSDPLNSGSVPPVHAGAEDIGGMLFLTLTYTRLAAATDAAFDVEVSTDLGAWNGGPAFVTEAFPPIDNGDGTLTVTQRSLVPSGSIPQEYIHLRVTLNP